MAAAPRRQPRRASKTAAIKVDVGEECEDMEWGEDEAKPIAQPPSHLPSSQEELLIPALAPVDMA